MSEDRSKEPGTVPDTPNRARSTSDSAGRPDRVPTSRGGAQASGEIPGQAPTELAHSASRSLSSSLLPVSQTEIRIPQTTQASSSQDILGLVLADRYEIIDRLGSGGMGVVYRARHVGLQKDVAVKVLLPELSAIPGVAERFEREALSLSKLDHPGIVRVIDFGHTDPGLLYLVMDFVEGEALSDLIRREAPFPADRAVSLCLQILLALDHAHGLGVIHRDLKPDNIMVVDPGTRSESIRILDFGIAKMLEDADEDDKEPLTKAGMVFGTPEYVSPEQASGEPDRVDMRSDLYTVGVILYEMLAGRRPFEASSRMALLNQHMTKKPPALPLDRPGRNIPRELATIVMKSLEKKRSDRFQSALEFYAALVHLSLDKRPLSLWPGAVPPEESLPSVHLERRPKRRAIWLLGALLLLLTAGAAGLWWWKRQEPPKPPPKTNVEDVDNLLSQLSPEQRKALQPVRRALVGVKPARALRILHPMVEKQPDSAPLWYLMGRAYGMLHTKTGALKMLYSYGKAAELDPKLVERPRFKQDLVLALNSKYSAVRNAAVHLIDTRIGKKAKDIIAQVTHTHNSYRLIRDLLVVADKYGIADSVDRIRLYKKMLYDAPTCAERAEAVRQLMLTKDRSLIPFLRKVLKRKPWKDGKRTLSNKCIEGLLRQAIVTLEQSQPDKK